MDEHRWSVLLVPRAPEERLKTHLTVFAALSVAWATTGCVTTPTDAPAKEPACTNVAKGCTGSEDLNDVAKALTESSVRTLLVLDIDDTLLTASTFYGSDNWFNWQRDPQTPKDAKVSCPLDVTAINTELGTQMETQTGASAIINPLIARFPSILLTSRNPGARGATLRELTLAGYQLPAQLDGGTDGAAWRYKDSAPDARTVTVTYDQGLFMTEGQNKGRILLNLLDRPGQPKFDRIVLVDDGVGNHQRMETELTKRGIEYRGVHFTKYKVAPTAKQKSEAVAAWRSFHSSLKKVFPKRADRLATEQCWLK